MVSDGIQVRLHGVTRIYPAGEGQKPVHALGPLDLDMRQALPAISVPTLRRACSRPT